MYISNETEAVSMTKKELIKVGTELGKKAVQNREKILDLVRFRMQYLDHDTSELLTPSCETYNIINFWACSESTLGNKTKARLEQNIEEVRKAIEFQEKYIVELAECIEVYENNMETKEQRKQRLEREVKTEYVSEVTEKWLNVKFENILPALKGSKTLEIVKERLGGKPASDKKIVEDVVKSLIQGKINTMDEDRIISLYNSNGYDCASDVITYLLG
jgi:hypothetical protein